MEERYLSVAEFAIKAGVTQATIYNMIKEGSLKFELKTIARRTSRYVPESELSKFKL